MVVGNTEGIFALLVLISAPLRLNPQQHASRTVARGRRGVHGRQQHKRRDCCAEDGPRTSRVGKVIAATSTPPLDPSVPWSAASSARRRADMAAPRPVAAALPVRRSDGSGGPPAARMSASVSLAAAMYSSADLDGYGRYDRRSCQSVGRCAWWRSPVQRPAWLVWMVGARQLGRKQSLSKRMRGDSKNQVRWRLF